MPTAQQMHRHRYPGTSIAMTSDNADAKVMLMSYNEPLSQADEVNF